MRRRPARLGSGKSVVGNPWLIANQRALGGQRRELEDAGRGDVLAEQGGSSSGHRRRAHRAPPRDRSASAGLRIPAMLLFAHPLHAHRPVARAGNTVIAWSSQFFILEGAVGNVDVPGSAGEIHAWISSTGRAGNHGAPASRRPSSRPRPSRTQSTVKFWRAATECVRRISAALRVARRKKHGWEVSGITLYFRLGLILWSRARIGFDDLPI